MRFSKQLYKCVARIKTTITAAAITITIPAVVVMDVMDVIMVVVAIIHAIRTMIMIMMMMMIMILLECLLYIDIIGSIVIILLGRHRHEK